MKELNRNGGEFVWINQIFLEVTISERLFFNTVKLCQLTENKTGCAWLCKGKTRQGTSHTQAWALHRGIPSQPNPAVPS